MEKRSGRPSIFDSECVNVKGMFQIPNYDTQMTKISDESRRYHREQRSMFLQINQYRVRYKSIFSKIKIFNFIINFRRIKNKKLRENFCLTQKEFQQFVLQIEPILKYQFNTMIRHVQSCLKQGHYNSIDLELQQVGSWLVQTRKQVRDKYKERLSKKFYTEIQRIKNKQQAIKIKEQQNQSNENEEDCFDMKIMQNQIKRIQNQYNQQCEKQQQEKLIKNIHEYFTFFYNDPKNKK